MLNGEHKGEDEDDARRTGYGDENEQHKRDGSYLWENFMELGQKKFSC